MTEGHKRAWGDEQVIAHLFSAADSIGTGMYGMTAVELRDLAARLRDKKQNKRAVEVQVRTRRKGWNETMDGESFE